MNLIAVSGAVLERIAAEQNADPASDDLTVPLAIELAEKDVEIRRLRHALTDIANGEIIQGMSPATFACKVLEEQ